MAVKSGANMVIGAIPNPTKYRPNRRLIFRIIPCAETGPTESASAVWIPLLLWPAFLKLQVHSDSMPRDARCHTQLLARYIHYDPLRHGVVGFQVLSQSQ